MADYGVNDFFEGSVDGLLRLAGKDTVIGAPINTPGGVTVIPVSKITMGFASGGVDLGNTKHQGSLSAGGGGGTGVSITPVAFLTVGKDADIRLIPINGTANGIDRIAGLIESSPEIIEKIKNILL